MNLAKCDQKFQNDFARAELKPVCPASTNGILIAERVDEIVDQVLMLAQVPAAMTEGQKKCAARMLAAAATAPRCMTQLLAAPLASGADFNYEAYQRCRDRGLKIVQRALMPGECVGSPGFEIEFDLIYAGQAGGGHLSGAKLSGVAFSLLPMENFDLSSGDLVGANFGLEFRGADFTNADLTNADFSSALDLRGVVFSGANLTGAALSQADVTDADLSGVVWSDTQCPDGSVSSFNGSSPESCCANLDGAIPMACSP